MSPARKDPDYQQDQDRLRDKEIYRYLFSLAVVYRKEKGNLDDHTNINFSQTGARFEEKADYARRIYNFITNQDNDGYNLPAKITTAELVKRLTTLLDNLDPGTIRQETINKLFGYLISLTHQERKGLSISKSEADILIQQSLLNLGYYNINSRKITDQQSQHGNLLKDSILQENILNLYKASLDLQNESGSDNQFFNEGEVFESNPRPIEKKVSKFIEKIITNHLQTIDLASTITEKISDYTDKIQRRLARIISQSGFDQIHSYSRDEVFRYYFTPKFIKNLAITTIENALIREKIPLYLEYFDIQRIQPLPLYSSPEIENSFLLNQSLKLNQKLDNIIDIPQDDCLTSLYAYRVTVWFRLGVEESEITTALDQLDKKTHKQMKAKLFNPQRKSIIFKVDSTGVGTQLSQMIKIINRALFWDVQCISESYFAIAHDLVHEVTGNQFGSPVWSHSLVRLCRLEYLEQALRDRGKYIDYVHVEDVARGDYLGFSLIEVSAKSALQARLAAILQANIYPERYKKDLIATIIRREILRTADNFLDYYPFSLNAMESFLTKCQYLKKSVTHFNSEDNNDLSSEFSHLYYDAYLAIIKTYLREGLYRKAKRYFDEIQIIEKISQDNLNNFRPDLPQRLGRECEIFSGGSLAKYEILKAYYLYLFDEEEKNIDYRWLGIDDHRKTNLISKAWDCLDNAWHHLQIRVAKYAAINEVSQAIFYPYFIMLSHISFRKAKLFLYFPTDSANRFPGVPELKNYHYARLYFFEQARLQAAKHGNQETYAVFTSVQVWAYVMAGYLQGGDKYLEGKEEDWIVTFPSGKSIDLRRKTCLKFAQELRDHALISYTEYGRNCYYQIKEKSGISDSAVHKLPHYGNFTVEPIPLIREERSNANQVEQGYSYFEDRLSGDGILRIDMALLHMRQLDNSDDFLEKDIYLFGTKAANLLFARGMCELCDDENTSKINEWKNKITKAYRLFTYAWATAEDGGKTEIENDNQYKITRPDFTHKAREDARKVSYPPPEALSVRDIYPHRLSEMSDIGKVFAITARLLLMYLTKTERPLEIAQANQKLEEYESEINQLMAHFHSTKRCNPVLIEGQKEFNGHLRPYLNQIKKISQTALQTFHSDNRKYPLDVEQIKKIRHYLVKDFFEALQKRN